MNIEQNTKIIETLGEHQRVSIGLSFGSPDRCACGHETIPLAGEEDVMVRRNAAFAVHQFRVLVDADLL